MKLLLLALIVCYVGVCMGFSLENRQANNSNPVMTISPVPAEQRPTILYQLEQMRYSRWVVYVSRFLNLLDDQEVSNKINDLIDGRREILQEALDCAEKLVVNYLNDPTTSFGRLAAMIRLGQGPLTKLRDLSSINLVTMLPMLWITIQNFNANQALKEAEDLVRSLSNFCLNGELKKYKDDVDFILEQFHSKVLS